MNKHFLVPADILPRLKVYLEDIAKHYDKNKMLLDTDITDLYSKGIDLFFKSLEQSTISDFAEQIKVGSPADPFTWNVFTDNLQKELKALFAELGALDKLVATSFGHINAEIAQLVQLNKKMSNKLGDYLLYADPSIGRGFFFGDSFGSSDKLDIGSNLVKNEECFVSNEEGVILLPVSDEERPSFKEIKINSVSNGSPGNNFQIDAPSGHDNIDAISDGEPNTWFEYEKVVADYSSSPLVLDLTIVLEELSVINHINIRPVNFGIQTPIVIETIETSREGEEYTSIKEEVPIKDFVAEDEKNEFELSFNSSKGTGEGWYSFLPRKAKFIHIVLKQPTPYPINTTVGSRLRYAIGLKDTNILGRKFNPEGSLVSSLFSSPSEIKKVSMWASENPVEENSLADVKHFVSSDNGASWLALQPQGRSGSDIPEVVNFNNVSPDSVETSSPVTSLRHKIAMTRNADEFTGNVSLDQKKLIQTEILSDISGGNNTINLAEQPVKNSLNLLLPFFGSFSCPTPRYGDSIQGKSPSMNLDFVTFSVDVPADHGIRYPLPFRGIKNLKKKIRVFVNGEQYQFSEKSDIALDVSSTSYNTIDEDSKVYFLNRDGLEIQFGVRDSSGAKRGFVPSTGSRIQICLDGDNPELELTDEGYMLQLEEYSDGAKENTSIVAFENLESSEASDYEIEIPSGNSQYIADSVKELTVTPTVDQLSLVSDKSISQSSDKKSVSLIKNLTKVSVESLKNQTKLLGATSYFAEGGKEGSIPTIFLPGTKNFEIKEYDLDGELITGNERQYTQKVPFVDGDSELREVSGGTKQEDRYTFDYYSGTVYLGSEPSSDRQVILIAKKLDASVVDSDMWSYYRDFRGKIDTSKIILDPRAVFTIKRKYNHSFVNKQKSISLVEWKAEHDWLQHKLVKGTVHPSPSFFANPSKALEVAFIDGQKEFDEIVRVTDENISATQSGNVYSFYLEKIEQGTELVGVPTFRPTRSENAVSTPESQFETQLDGSDLLKNHGEWKFEKIGNKVKVSVFISGSFNDHTAGYRYKETTSVSDSLFSIDYEKGIVYFAKPITKAGVIDYEVSLYSAFYNIAKQIEDRDIEKVDSKNKKVTLKPSFVLNNLRQNTAANSRPKYLIADYQYFKKTTESLADLEPYFSPICKDIGFKNVTVDVLEEL